MPKVENLVQKANTTVEQSGKQIAEITSRANDILDSTKRQLTIVEEVVGDAAARAKVQMDRVELVVDDTLSRAHETVAVVHEGIMRPLREVSGVAAGIRAALGAMARGNRPTRGSSYQRRRNVYLDPSGPYWGGGVVGVGEPAGVDGLVGLELNGLEADEFPNDELFPSGPAPFWFCCICCWTFCCALTAAAPIIVLSFLMS